DTALLRGNNTSEAPRYLDRKKCTGSGTSYGNSSISSSYLCIFLCCNGYDCDAYWY
ncbi:hypothetical protein CSUI_008089, partial [Cystoisospora suis]